MSMKQYVLAVLLTFFGLPVLAQTAKANSHQSIEKLIPNEILVSTVAQLRSLGLWNTAYDNQPNSAISISTAKFILALKNPSVSDAQIAELLFELGPCSESGLLLTECELYTAKVIIFRQFTSLISADRKAGLEQAFVRKYLDLTLNLLDHSKFQPIQVISQRMRSMIASNSLRLFDLNEQVKASLPRNQHLDPSKATGAYLPQLRSLGIDLSKGISQNAISIAHETVHAADPELESLQKQMINLYPRLLARLGQALETPQAAQVLINSLLVDAYYEVRGDTFTEYVLKSLKDTTAKLELSDAVKNDPDLARDETLKEWTRLLVKITVENEFRANIFSAAIYYQLAETMRIIGTDQEIVTFSRFLLANPIGFAVTRGRLVDPFAKGLQLSRIEKEVQEALTKESGNKWLDTVDRDSKTISAKFKYQLNAVKSILQLHYLTELKEETQKYASRYSSEIEYIRLRQQSSETFERKLSFLPEYVREGYRADKVDAYTVLTARISAAVILRFQESVGLLNKDIDVFMSQLLTMKAKILDLSGLSFGELKLLGLQSSNAVAAGSALSGQQANEDLGMEQARYLQFFNLETWGSTDYLKQPVLEQENLQSALYRLRILKFLSWFEKKFPFGRNNLISARIIHDRLRDGQFDRAEIDDEAASQLMKEAIAASNEASLAAASIQQMDYLFNSLSAVYELGILPEGADWNAVMTRFNDRMKFEQNLLRDNGINFEFNAKDFESSFAASLLQAKEQIRKETASTCKGLAVRSVGLISTLSTFRLNQKPISNVIALCSNKQVYLLRKSDDRTNAAPSDIVNGRMQTQVSFTSRYSYLKPFIEVSSRLSDWWR